MPTKPRPNGVATDMERIFRPLEGRAPHAPVNRQAAIPRRRGQAGFGWRGITVVAPVPVLLATAALALNYGQADPPGTRVSEPSARMPISAVADRSISQRDVGLPPPSHSTAEAEPTPGARPPIEGGSIAPDRAAAPVSAAAGRPLRQAAMDRRIFRSSSPPIQTKAIASARRRDREASAYSAAPSDCALGSEEDRCIFEDVLDADARLRLAYGRARRAGVSAHRLTIVNKRWRDAREDADVDPDGTIRRYERLAQVLDEERHEASR